MKKTSNIVAIFCFLTAIIFVVTLYALTFQIIGVDTSNKATIFSGVMSMIGGFAGALGAYFVASNQMNKQFEHEKLKGTKQKIETNIQNLKKLELLNIETIEFIDFFEEEYSKEFNMERIARLKYSEKDLNWIVNNVNNMDVEKLMDGYAVDYLRYSRELNSMYIDVIGIDGFLPEEQRAHNIKNLIRAMLVRRGNFVSFDNYLKEHIEDLQKELINLN